MDGIACAGAWLCFLVSNDVCIYTVYIYTKMWMQCIAVHIYPCCTKHQPITTLVLKCTSFLPSISPSSDHVSFSFRSVSSQKCCHQKKVTVGQEREREGGRAKVRVWVSKLFRERERAKEHKSQAQPDQPFSDWVRILYANVCSLFHVATDTRILSVPKTAFLWKRLSQPLTPCIPVLGTSSASSADHGGSFKTIQRWSMVVERAGRSFSQRWQLQLRSCGRTSAVEKAASFLPLADPCWLGMF